MVTVMTADRKRLILREVRKPLQQVSPNWYNSLYKSLSNVRYAAYSRKAVPDIETLKLQLEADPYIHIYTILSHYPIFSQADEENIRLGKQSRAFLEDSQRVRIGDDWYIDEFGFYVYLVSRLGYEQDQDRRYDTPEPELFNLEHVEHDICDRKPDRMDSRISTG